jgi:ferredoxin-NADP reductase/predicted pyridoxine 5'-phosphate oxidase superfamily flavin-nucleotide-binding protein
MSSIFSSTHEGVWHEGELRLQRALGVADKMDEIGRRVLRDHLIEQHARFYAQLPFIVLGTVDDSGDSWATIRAGRPGFLSVTDEKRLDIELTPDPTDPADGGLTEGAGVGLLGIELHTRRRNRLNGTLRRADGRHLSVQVDQSYGNCPQYIQIRDFSFVRDPRALEAMSPTESSTIETHAAELIRRSDTFFVASYMVDQTGRRRVDVSHRGGRSGFVQLNQDGGLTIPDFAGNLFFNTLGNFVLNPKAGLIFVDFETGDVLQMTGDAEVLLDSPDIEAFEGAERLWRFQPRKIVNRPGSLPLRWRFSGGWSPNSLLTGDWEKAAARRQAKSLVRDWRRYRISNSVDESSVVRSLTLEPTDGLGIVPFLAGQHVSLRATFPGEAALSVRNYSLSLAPSDGRYRISVKRDGRMSGFLHDATIGDTVEVRGPSGSFTIDAAEERPAVLIAAGIGITPILSMLRHIIYEGARTRRLRQTWIFYAARSKAERAFDAEIARLVKIANGRFQLIRYLSAPSEGQREDYEAIGRLGATSIAAALPEGPFDYYLCGPSGFMQSIYDELRQRDVADDSIHAEAFGSAGLRRQRDASTNANVEVAQGPVQVKFRVLGKTMTWTSNSGSLLDLAEAAGLKPDFQCREGACGTCATRIISGAVAYRNMPTAEAGPDEALICCALPAASDQYLELYL